MRLEYYLTQYSWSTAEGQAKPFMSNTYQEPATPDARVFRVIIDLPPWPGVVDVKPTSVQEVVSAK